MSSNPKNVRGGHAVCFLTDGELLSPQASFDEHPLKMMDPGAGALPVAG